MNETARLYLLTPVVSDPEAFAPILDAACAAGDVAALLLRLAPDDDRTLINAIKRLAPIAQQHGVAILANLPPQIAVRGGADGAHLSAPTEEGLKEAVSALHPDRIVGAGRLKQRHDAMVAGESNVDYVMFGEPYPDGVLPDPADTLEWAQWWADVFATPCVACASSMAEVAPLAATNAEFVALGPWAFDTDVAAQVKTALDILACTEAPTA